MRTFTLTLSKKREDIPPNREKHNQPLNARFIDPAPLPEDAEPIDKMRNKHKGLDGRKVYAQHKSTVEPVFWYH